MIKLNKNETAVYKAIETAVTAEDIAVITEMKKASVLGVLASLIKKNVAQSQVNDDVKMYARTEAEVDLHVEQVQEQMQIEETVQAEAVQVAETVQEQAQVQTETAQEQVQEQAKEKLDNNKFKKDGSARKVTNAMLIREEIAKVKATMSKDDAIAHVIMFGMTVLGQSKQLAKKYVTENYVKVNVEA